MAQTPTFKHPILEQMANALFQGNDRRLLMTNAAMFPHNAEMLEYGDRMLQSLYQEKEALEAKIRSQELMQAFGRLAAELQPDGIEIDWHGQ